MKAGSIEFSGHAIACLIRNQSETGAALELVSAIELPAQFNRQEADQGSGREGARGFTPPDLSPPRLADLRFRPLLRY
jgi:hypothetical protein